MNQLKLALRRPVIAFVAFALAVSGLLPFLVGSASAFGQVTTRSIQMSDSTPGATGVSYKVTFTPASSTTIKAIAVDFCSNSPLAGDSCTIPTGFSVGTPTVNVSSVSGETGGTWTAAAQNSGRTLTLSNGSATGTPSGTTTFELTTVTNPTVAPPASTTFFARIITFGSTADLTTWLTTADGSDAGSEVVDFGGIALSTAENIKVTAKVQESLTFCVAGALITSCSTATTPSVNLGHTVGTSFALTEGQVDSAAAYTQTSTNAQHGVIVNMKDPNAAATCAGLSTNNQVTDCSIASVGSTAAAIAAGDAKIGMCVQTGSANTTATTPYNDGTCTSTWSGTLTYGFDDTQLRSTYGSQIFSSAGPLNAESNVLNFAATAALTTPAGIYTGTYALIATGSF
jgi:hypothetical protein